MNCRWCGEDDHIERECVIKMKRQLPIIPARREKVTGIILNNHLKAKGMTDTDILRKFTLAWWVQAYMESLPKPGTFRWADLDST